MCPEGKITSCEKVMGFGGSLSFRGHSEWKQDGERLVLVHYKRSSSTLLIILSKSLGLGTRDYWDPNKDAIF